MYVRVYVCMHVDQGDINAKCTYDVLGGLDNLDQDRCMCVCMHMGQGDFCGKQTCDVGSIWTHD
jgi:hypothetical protein